MAPSHVDEPQISAEEMEQIEDFFAQLDKAEAQSDSRSRQPNFAIDAEEHGKAYIDAVHGRHKTVRRRCDERLFDSIQEF